MSQLDRFLLAFRRDLANASPHGLDHYVRLYWDDRPAFYQAHDAAWATGRAEPYSTLTVARALNEALSVKTARRFARRLLTVGRFQEAANLLRDRRFHLMQDASALLELAGVELGLGRLAEAAFVTAQALDLDPAFAGQAAELRGALDGLQAAQEKAAASRAWADAHVLFELWIQAGSLEGAMQTLTTFLIGGAPLEKDDLGAFHQAFDTVLSVCRPASAYHLFRAFARQPIYQGYGEALEAVCASLYRDDSEAPVPMPEVAAMGPAIGASAALALGQMGRIQEAIAILGALSLAYHKAHYFRPPLARYVAQDVLSSHPLRYGPEGGGRKVFDVFLFNNELRILEMKLHEMADWVDGFVLVEARQTFTGAPKPLVFQENRDRFARFADKIVHVVVDEFPAHVRHPWAREYHQRDMGVTGLSGRVRPDDLVIISDSDEVISRGALRDFDGEHAPMGLERMRFFLNYRQVLPPNQLKEYPSVWRAGYLRTIGLSTARETLRHEKKGRRISPAGWHFTSVADASGIAAKLNIGSHQEFAGASAEALEAVLAELRAGRLESGWERCEVDERFPDYLRLHIDEFGDLML